MDLFVDDMVAFYIASLHQSTHACYVGDYDPSLFLCCRTPAVRGYKLPHLPHRECLDK